MTYVVVFDKCSDRVLQLKTVFQDMAKSSGFRASGTGLAQ